jgi:hypothetical protein
MQLQLQHSADSRGHRCSGVRLDRDVYIGVRWRQEALDSRDAGTAREARLAIVQMVVGCRDSEARGPTHFLNTRACHRLTSLAGDFSKECEHGEAVHLL